MADIISNDGDLNESQLSSLAQFMELTQQDKSEALGLLQRSQWNVQIAITRHFEGETADSTAETNDESPTIETRRRALPETLLNGTAPRQARVNRIIDPAPRIVPQQDTQALHQIPYMISLLFMPATLLYQVIKASLGYLSYLFPALPQLILRLLPRRPNHISTKTTESPRETARSFKVWFEKEFGKSTLPFFEDGYAQAYDQAKKDLKFLLVILFSPEHDDTCAFAQKTLLSPTVAEFMQTPQNNIILWAGSVKDSEAYELSSALGCTKFPFSALIAPTAQSITASMSVVARITGPILPSDFITILATAITQYSDNLRTLKSSRRAQQAERNLREEQNSAYEKSLAQDRERARLKREAEAKLLQEKQAIDQKAKADQKRVNDLAQWRRWKSRDIETEPGPESQDAIRISIRLPSGDKVVRRFPSATKLEDLYAFVECRDATDLGPERDELLLSKPKDFEPQYRFRLVSPFPRTVYEISKAIFVKDKLGKSGNLIVEPILEDSCSDEE
ncbi:MAG: hypothetical protein M1829_005328 [Trizodia sp. TS-e1964]|nr:MAG: hypothetical protein M1829_005328 [Trizodia sp. TS-e1964]